METCKFCNKQYEKKSSLIQHIIRCNSNPQKITSKNLIWTKERREAHSKIMKEKNTNSKRIFSVEKRKQLSERFKKFNSTHWTKENREKHSKIMKDVVEKHPESYMTSKILSRCKKVYTTDNLGETIKVDGGWELKFIEWLNINQILWERNTKKFIYTFKEKDHYYFPDFYLQEYDLYIEIKGYQRDRDSFKWEALINIHNKKLVILKQLQIKQIEENKFTVKDLLSKINNVNFH